MSARDQRMQAMENDYALSELCLAFAVSRSGYYAWSGRKPSARQQANTPLLEEIQTLRQSEEASYGSPRMTEELQARGYKCSENRIARLMHAHGLRAQAWPRFVPCTTDSDHDLPVAPNRLAERATPAGPNQIWLQDITDGRRPRAGWIWPWSWICGAARSSAGRWPTISQRTGGRRAAHGPHPAPPGQGLAGAFGSRRAIRQAGKPGNSGHATAGRPA